MHAIHTSVKETQKAQGEQFQLVHFCVNNEHYAVEILRVQEINRMMTITQVPQSPAGVEGVINLRGRIVPIVDLHMRFGMPKGERTDESRIVVVDAGVGIVGFIVDKVHEVLRIGRSAVDAAPGISSRVEPRCIRSVAKLGNQVIILLDVDALLGEQLARYTARLSA
jgi:purine-binding chemotaxis protein CheW